MQYVCNVQLKSLQTLYLCGAFSISLCLAVFLSVSGCLSLCLSLLLAATTMSDSIQDIMSAFEASAALQTSSRAGG